jgi:carboxylesterase
MIDLENIESIINPHLEGGSFLWEGGETGVLLSHGFTATTAEVRPLAKMIHQRGYTVAGPLLPGHGTRPEDLNRCRWQDWANTIEEAYLDLAARCSRVFVGGESLGALLALYHGARHPKISGILAYAAALKVPSPTTPLLTRMLAPFVPYRSKAKGAPRPSDALWQGYSVNPTAAAVQLFRLQRIVRSQLPNIHTPLLLVHGREDQTIDPLSSEIIYRETPSKVKELHWLGKSGHCLILDCELQAVEHITLDFLEMVLAIPETNKG